MSRSDFVPTSTRVENGARVVRQECGSPVWWFVATCSDDVRRFRKQSERFLKWLDKLQFLDGLIERLALEREQYGLDPVDDPIGHLRDSGRLDSVNVRDLDRSGVVMRVRMFDRMLWVGDDEIVTGLVRSGKRNAMTGSELGDLYEVAVHDGREVADRAVEAFWRVRYAMG